MAFTDAIDAENIPFDDNQFDSIFTSYSIHHIGNIERMLQEVRRVLKPGGHFFGVDIAAPSLKKLYKKDINNRTPRAMDFGRLEESLRFEDWLAILLKSRVPGAILSYEPGPKKKSQQVKKIQNITRRIPNWISFDKKG